MGYFFHHKRVPKTKFADKLDYFCRALLNFKLFLNMEKIKRNFKKFEKKFGFQQKKSFDAGPTLNLGLGS